MTRNRTSLRPTPAHHLEADEENEAWEAISHAYNLRVLGYEKYPALMLARQA